MQYDRYPTPSENQDEDVLSLDEIKTNSSNSDDLQIELESNGEDTTQSAYYKVDLSKLEIEKTTRGTKKNGDDKDIYVVSAKTGKVYYLKGVKVGGKNYFSLTSELVGFVKTVGTPTETDSENTQVDVQGSLTVKKLNKTWTNEMGLTLTTYMNAGETLQIKYPTPAVNVEGLDTQFAEAKGIATGNNVKKINKLSDIIEIDETADVVTAFKSLTGTNKYIEIEKKKETEVIDTIKVDLSNYDAISPKVDETSYKLDDSSFTNNEFSFKVSDNESGIKQVRYDYIEKYNNETGLTESYYEGIDLDETMPLEPTFVRAKGKKANIGENGEVSINLPKDIAGVEILVEDKAGNYTVIKRDVTGDLEGTNSYVYIGSKLRTITSEGLTFNAIFNTTNCTLSKYNIQISNTGDTVIGTLEKTPTLNLEGNVTNPYIENINDFVSGLAIEDKVYVKIVATVTTEEGSTLTKTRMFTFSLDDEVEEEEDNKYNTEELRYIDEVPIPIGFVASEATGESTKEEGLVIYDGNEPVTDANVEEAKTTRNQFVWIPVDDFSKFTRYSWENEEPVTYDFGFYESNSAMRESVEKYHGFYMSRYRASEGSVEDFFYRCKSVKGGTTFSSVYFHTKYDSLWGNRVNADGAVDMASCMYLPRDTVGSVVSTLPYGVQWDAMLLFYKDKKTTNSANIEEINKSSWTMECETTSPPTVGDWEDVEYVYRYNAFTRASEGGTSGYSSDKNGFRVALYIK